MAKVAAQHELARLTNHPQDHGFDLPRSAPQVIAATKALEKAKASLSG